MKKPIFPTAKVCFFILVILGYHLTVFGQMPPTSGPNPKDTNLTPYIIAGSGLVVGAGSYFYLKTRGPKIPVTDNLRDYLWRQNIMPTPDALSLMYELNPGLRGKEVMREKKKLIAPELPEIPDEIIKASADVPPPTYIMPDHLKELTEEFKSSLNAFRGITVKTTHPDAPKDAFNEVLTKLEANLTAPERYTEARSSVRDLLLTDLITVVNQTMEEAIQTQELSGDKLDLLHAIAADLETLLFPNLNPPQMEVGKNKDGDQLADRSLFLASVDNNPNPNWNNHSVLQRDFHSDVIHPNDPEDPDLKWFAFAVYKYNDEGDLITQGREVENRYQIFYALPSLKDYEGRFHPIDGNASYGSALLGNGKYYIKVKDGEVEVPIQRPEIHFGQAFHNPLKELHKGLTKVIIQLSR